MAQEKITAKELAREKLRRRKSYEKPTVAKGPVLAAATAGVATSQAVPEICWVARAAFGETDIRWMIFRGWLLEEAPAWFRGLYIRYGESVAACLAGRECARSVVRALMMPAVRRKLR